MKTLTIKIADIGTLYGTPPDVHPSDAGHMWLSVDIDGPNGPTMATSMGFASVNHKAIDVGDVFFDDDQKYGSTYYTGTITIDDTQYAQLIDFGNNPLNYGFDKDNYNLARVGWADARKPNINEAHNVGLSSVG